MKPFPTANPLDPVIKPLPENPFNPLKPKITTTTTTTLVEAPKTTIAQQPASTPITPTATAAPITKPIPDVPEETVYADIDNNNVIDFDSGVSTLKTTTAAVFASVGLFLYTLL